MQIFGRLQKNNKFYIALTKSFLRCGKMDEANVKKLQFLSVWFGEEEEGGSFSL